MSASTKGSTMPQREAPTPRAPDGARTIGNQREVGRGVVMVVGKGEQLEIGPFRAGCRKRATKALRITDAAERQCWTSEHGGQRSRGTIHIDQRLCCECCCRERSRSVLRDLRPQILEQLRLTQVRTRNQNKRCACE